MGSFFANLNTFGSWCGSHSNKIASTARACYMAAVALNWTHLTPEQIGAIGLAAESILGLFIESTTVSTKRMGERIEAVKAEAASGIVQAPRP